MKFGVTRERRLIAFELWDRLDNRRLCIVFKFTTTHWGIGVSIEFHKSSFVYFGWSLACFGGGVTIGTRRYY